MELEELQKQLYGQKGDEVKRAGAPEQFEPGHGADGQGPGSSQWDKEKGGKEPMWSNAGKIIKFALLFFVIIAIMVGGIIFWRSRSFDNSKVSVTIFGVDRVMSGEEVNYVVRYQNNTNVTLTDLKLTFIYPADSLPSNKENLTQIGDQQATVIGLENLDAGQEGKAEFPASLTGMKDDKKEASAKLTYHAGATSSSYESAGQYTSIIFSVPIVLDLSLPDRVVNGQEVTMNLKYLNTADVSFSDLILTVNFPPGFSFNSAQPAPTQGSDTWVLPEISPREEGKITISGVLVGAQEEVKAFRASMSKKEGDTGKVISEGLASTLITLSPLSVSLTVNDRRDYAANVSDRLSYKLIYQNNADVPIGPVFITVKFDTKAIDFTRVDAPRGFFSSSDTTITFNESTYKILKLVQPGEKEELLFAAIVKDTLPISKFTDKNFMINLTAKIDTAAVPVSLRGTQIAGTDSLNTKVNSKFYLSSKGYYKDTSQPNSGPIPPKVGVPTTYTIYWDIVNLANDVDNVVVESYLPPYISWLARFAPADADVKYDQNTGKLTWTVGRLSANVGILTPVRRLIFKISFLPSVNQVGDMVDLVAETKISGQDTFSGETIQGTARSIRSDLAEDPSVGSGGGKVSP